MCAEGDATGDLQDFFSKDWIAHDEQLFAVTYGLYFEDYLVAMFSVANDRVDAKEMGKTEEDRKTALSKVPDSKQAYVHYPAVKIARLAVADGWRGMGVGSFIISFLKSFFVIRNKTGCRYMTVDSYEASVGFYSKAGGFQPFPNRKGGHTAMYADLFLTKNQLDEFPEIKSQYEERIRVYSPHDSIEFEIGVP